MNAAEWSEVAVVLRAIDERTVDASRQLILSACPGVDIYQVTRCPFSEALRESFELGIASGRLWTVTIDGDVLPRADAISRLVAMAARLPSEVFLCQGLILDKLFGCPRQAGLHLYRTELLAEALGEFSDELERQLRPEFYILSRMKERGFRVEVLRDTVLGLHDYEQFYRDIYRKSFIHAKKHSRCVHLLAPHWKRLAEHDPDYQIALLGARAGDAFPWDLPIDLRVLPTEITPLLACLELSEKELLAAHEWPASRVEDTLLSHQPWPGSGLLQQLTGYRTSPTLLEKLGDVRDAVGLGRVIPWYFGSKLRNLGKRIVSWAEKR
jgi:hypothetical protein